MNASNVAAKERGTAAAGTLLGQQVIICLRGCCAAGVPGIYADLDFESLRSLEPLLQGEQLVLAAMTADLDWHQAIPNAWMASARRHPFWLFTLAEIIRAVGANDTERHAHAAVPVCWA